MSKRVRIDIQCPHCRKSYSDEFFRTIWGENESLRALVMEDRVNIAKCPHCGHEFHLPLGMMYVDIKKGFAVWWEPNHDSGIDCDAKGYAQMMGPQSFYATAPRIADWEEFKETINKYYRGELTGGPITKMDLSVLSSTSGKKVPKKNGCLGVVIALAVPLALLLLL